MSGRRARGRAPTRAGGGTRAYLRARDPSERADHAKPNRVREPRAVESAARVAAATAETNAPAARCDEQHFSARARADGRADAPISFPRAPAAKKSERRRGRSHGARAWIRPPLTLPLALSPAPALRVPFRARDERPARRRPRPRPRQAQGAAARAPRRAQAPRASARLRALHEARRLRAARGRRARAQEGGGERDDDARRARAQGGPHVRVQHVQARGGGARELDPARPGPPPDARGGGRIALGIRRARPAPPPPRRRSPPRDSARSCAAWRSTWTPRSSPARRAS